MEGGFPTWIGTVGIYIQYILHSLVLSFDPKGGGWGVRVVTFFLEKTIFSHFMFDSDWMLFEFFLKYIF